MLQDKSLTIRGPQQQVADESDSDFDVDWSSSDLLRTLLDLDFCKQQTALLLCKKLDKKIQFCICITKEFSLNVGNSDPSFGVEVGFL